MPPSRAADRGTAATLAGRNPLARLRLQPARRASARGAMIGASSPPVTASVSLPASCGSTAPESLLSSGSSVPPCGPSNSSRSASGASRPRVVGHGVLLRGASPSPRWVCRSQAHAPWSSPARWPPLHHTARPPRPSSGRPGCCRRTARSAGPAPAERGTRSTSALPFEDARRAEGGFLIRAASTSPATAGLTAVPGVAALLRAHPSQHQLWLVPGALPPSSPSTFWSVRAAVISLLPGWRRTARGPRRRCRR